jgi:hypothetical protein
MVTVSDAESTLKTIRSLMERATIYRTLSAPTSLCAGIFSLVLSLFVWLSFCQSTRFFIFLWLALAIVLSALNTLLLKRDARRRGEPFVSSGMKLALRGIIPPILAGASVTLFQLLGEPILTELIPLWMLFYGLTLLSTQEFAPSSIRKLGAAFIAAGLLTGLLASLWRLEGNSHFAALSMGLTFGLLHILYGLLTWSSKETSNGTGVNEGL